MVIPVIIVSGGTVQFGAVYFLEHIFYPLSVFLTPSLSLYQLRDVQLNPVLQADLTVLSMPCTQRRHMGPSMSLLTLNIDKYFFKPLQQKMNNGGAESAVVGSRIQRKPFRRFDDAVDLTTLMVHFLCGCVYRNMRAKRCFIQYRE